MGISIEKKKYPSPCLGYRFFFEVDLGTSQIYRNALEFSIFLYRPPWKSTFFLPLLVYPKIEIQTIITQTPLNYALISSTRGFLEKPNVRRCKVVHIKQT